MQIKAADDKQPDIDALNALLARPNLDAGTRGRIESELRRIVAGAKGERDAAYEIEFDHGPSRKRMTIHGLRLEVEGRVAQIDHLIIPVPAPAMTTSGPSSHSTMRRWALVRSPVSDR
jgi:hypothetical protein